MYSWGPAQIPQVLCQHLLFSLTFVVLPLLVERTAVSLVPDRVGGRRGWDGSPGHADAAAGGGWASATPAALGFGDGHPRVCVLPHPTTTNAIAPECHLASWLGSHNLLIVSLLSFY